MIHAARFAGPDAWSLITALGDTAVLLPGIGLATLWLAVPATTRDLAVRWLVSTAVVAALVCATKIAFMGWLVSLPGADFTGISGHTAMAMMVWPSLGALAGGRGGRAWQRAGTLLGAVLGLAIGWSRYVLHAHSLVEVVSGWVLGGAACAAFLWRYRTRWVLPERLYLAVLSMALVLPWVYGDRFPSQQLLEAAVRHWSGHPAYTRADLLRARHLGRG